MPVTKNGNLLMQIIFAILAIALPACLIYIAIEMLSKPSAQEEIQFAILKEECDTSRQAKISYGGKCDYRILLKNVITDAEIETISRHIKKKAPSVERITILYVLPCMEYVGKWRWVNFDPKYDDFSKNLSASYGIAKYPNYKASDHNAIHSMIKDEEKIQQQAEKWDGEMEKINWNLDKWEGDAIFTIYRDKSDPVYQCMKNNKHIYKEMVEGFIYASEQYYKTERRKQEMRKSGWDKIKPTLEEIAS